MSNLKMVYSKENTVSQVASIATSAVLLDLHISAWTGRKRDKKTTAEVNANKQAQSDKASSVIKNLMADDKELDALRAFAQTTRLWLNARTLTWSDGGTRLLPSSLIFEVTGELTARAAEYEKMADAFVDGYALKVSAAAFKLGQLFDRAEFPPVQAVRRKFAMWYTMTPVPTSGDFRVDVQNDVSEMLRQQYEQHAQTLVADIMREPWQRVYDSVTHIQERMNAVLEFESKGEDDTRRRPKLFQSMLDNAAEQVALLDKLNVTGDPKLADCAQRMRDMLSRVSIESLRESRELQESVRTKTQEILDTFEFGDFKMED